MTLACTTRRVAVLRHWRWLVGRVVWSVLLAFHGWWLIRSFMPTAGLAGAVDVVVSPLSQIALLLSVAFFLLKAIDVPHLRVRLDRRSMVAVVMIVVLVHAGPIHRSLDGEVPLLLWSLPVVVGWPGCIRLLRSCAVRRRARRFFLVIAAALGDVPRHWTRSFWRHVAGALLPDQRYAAAALCVPRAPPV